MPAPDSVAPLDAPDHWLGPTDLLDLGDAKLRMRARSITQLAKNEREKALAIYGFVKRIPFARPFKFRLRTPREVLGAGRGDALDKAGLFVALLRVADIPARIRLMELPGEMLRGLISHLSIVARPVVELYIGGKWIATDTYIFDAIYMAAARQRLTEEDSECGYGIHREGASIWNGMEDAFLVGTAVARRQLAQGEGAVFHDPAEFMASDAFRALHPRLTNALQYNVTAPATRKVTRKLREEATRGAGPRRRGG